MDNIILTSKILKMFLRYRSQETAIDMTTLQQFTDMLINHNQHNEA